MDKEYQNIDCGLYDQYVLYAMRKTKFLLNETEEVFIKDLQTEDGKEYMVLSNGSSFRLDLVELKDGKILING